MCIWVASYVQLALSDKYVNEHRKILKSKAPIKNPVEQDEVNWIILIDFKIQTLVNNRFLGVGALEGNWFHLV